MTVNPSSTSIDGHGQSGITSSLKSIGYPSLELKDNSITKVFSKKKRRIYQLGFSMPCSENDENCVDDFSKSR